ncbi:MAG: copper chaperone CopZ [Saprospiraceae bacterium]|jgi:copper chaperone CopZ
MKHTYNVDGMTCQNCKADVTNTLKGIDGITSVDVDLDEKEATIVMDYHIETSTLRSQLSEKYTISEKNVNMPSTGAVVEEKSKFSQLKPLFLILSYITVASVLIHMQDWKIGQMMIDFMGLFFIVFSFFKMLDLNGFAMSFSMYDPIAKRLPFYAKIYPFIETVLGLMLLMRFNVDIALWATIVILGFTTYGVTKTLLSKRTIKCACLGTALDLPMTEATFIENTLMISMSVVMLLL